MASLGPIMLWEVLPMSKGGPSAFAAVESCRWFRLGLLMFWEVLPMSEGGPINLLGGAADV